MRSLAPLIKTCLLDLEIKVNVTVRQKRKELHILLESTNFGDRQLLVEAIAKCCYDYEDRNFKAARIYAFWFGQPLPQWIERIEFEQEKSSEEITEKEQQKTTINLGSDHESICDRFIVCGLGSLGQHSVFNLKKFTYREYEVKICAIDRVQPEIM